MLYYVGLVCFGRVFKNFEFQYLGGGGGFRKMNISCGSMKILGGHYSPGLTLLVTPMF